MEIYLYLIFLIFVLGICIGSFLNVVILRAFSNESIVFPASKCPNCQHKLKWYHNIPILSYLLLRGKCAFCKNKISIQYPIIEFITGFIFVVVFLKFGFSINTILGWIVSSLAVVLSVTDIKEKIIFLPHVYCLIGSSFLFSMINGNLHLDVLISSIIGLILGVLIMEILARVGYIFAGTRAFGEGDTYIAAAMGLLFGWKILPIALILSLIIQFVFTIPIFLVKLLKNKDYITFSTFILFAGAIVLCKIPAVPFIISILALLTLAIFLCYRLLKDLRKENDFTYLPFGPAMLLASFFLLILL